MDLALAHTVLRRASRGEVGPVLRIYRPVADAVAQPLAALSPEMVFRGLYHYTQAYHRNPQLEVVSYLAAEARGLGILKRKRRPRLPKAT